MESHKQSERRQPPAHPFADNKLEKPAREDYCTNLSRKWCDCDWCRVNNHWRKS